jgi:hypothetical protein
VLVIEAEAHSDDYNVQISFDATAWFEEADDESIIDLAECGWGGDYPADEVAQYFEETFTKRLFTYLSFSPTMPWSGDTVGFECNVQAEQALVWIASRRPHLLAQLS